MLTITDLADATERYMDFDAVVSVENPTVGKRLRYEAADGAPEQLVLAFDDIDHDHGDDFVTMPAAEHIRAALDFARRHDGGRLLVHCQAGKCRSTAIALAIIAERLGPDMEREAVAELLAIRPAALVNLVALAAADEVLSRDGRLVEAWKAFEDVTPAASERRARKSEHHANLRRRWMREGRIVVRAEDLAPSP